jgi:hypothetical protein
VKLMTQRPLDHDPTPSAPFAAAGSESTQEYRTQPYLEGSTREDGSGSTEGQSTKDKAQQVAGTAKGEAKNVAGTAVDSGKDVARTAKDEAAQVASEAKHQAASLFDTVRSEAGQQVSTSQNRIAEALHGLSKELGGMASSSSESGPLTDLAHEGELQCDVTVVSDGEEEIGGDSVVRWLDERGRSYDAALVFDGGLVEEGWPLLTVGVRGVITGSLRVTTGVRDLSGNAMFNPFSVTFAVSPVDTTPPRVTGNLPNAFTPNVPLNTAVTITFSEDLNPSTVIASNLYLDGVMASVSWNSATRTATLTPVADLPPATTISGHVTTGVRDLANLPLGLASPVPIPWVRRVIRVLAAHGLIIDPHEPLPEDTQA